MTAQFPMYTRDSQPLRKCAGVCPGMFGQPTGHCKVLVTGRALKGLSHPCGRASSSCWDRKSPCHTRTQKTSRVSSAGPGEFGQVAWSKKTLRTGCLAGRVLIRLLDMAEPLPRVAHAEGFSPVWARACFAKSVRTHVRSFSGRDSVEGDFFLDCGI